MSLNKLVKAKIFKKDGEASDGLEEKTGFVWDGRYTYILPTRIPTSL